MLELVILVLNRQKQIYILKLIIVKIISNRLEFKYNKIGNNNWIKYK